MVLDAVEAGGSGQRRHGTGVQRPLAAVVSNSAARTIRTLVADNCSAAADSALRATVDWACNLAVQNSVNWAQGIRVITEAGGRRCAKPWSQSVRSAFPECGDVRRLLHTGALLVSPSKVLRRFGAMQLPYFARAA